MENNNRSSEENITLEEDIILEEETLNFLEDEVQCDELCEYDGDFSTSDYVITSLVDTWQRQQEEDRKLKSKYGIWVMVLLLSEIIFLGIVFVFIGLGHLVFNELVINAFVLTVFGQIIGIVYIIVKNLFSDGNQIIDIIKEYIK